MELKPPVAVKIRSQVPQRTSLPLSLRHLSPLVVRRYDRSSALVIFNAAGTRRSSSCRVCRVSSAAIHTTFAEVALKPREVVATFSIDLRDETIRADTLVISLSLWSSSSLSVGRAADVDTVASTYRLSNVQLLFMPAVLTANVKDETDAFMLWNFSMAATCVVHPMDVIKNRIQVQKERAGIRTIMKSIYENEGFLKFYSGLTAGLVRQATYTTVRLGIYNQLQEYWKDKYSDKPSFGILSLMAATAGACGAFVGTPAEVALVRMTADGRLPKDQRRNYKNVIHAFTTIAKNEGITTLWRGSVATMGRAVVVNVSQLATYSHIKFLIATNTHMTEGVGLYFCASMLSGFLTTFNSMPFDVTKTRIQNLQISTKPPGMFSMMSSIAKNESIKALWKGFWPTYCRVGPHTVLTLIINEQIANLYRRYAE
ncbi:mitochondrial 2-oxoglutarate/malate carrier protein [Ptiloglossa arizonensis]|uniref:mitochondrial 2-oxoglutarate/malate carrier protein n=1 Tax=Ptiloglossa arizonensis TaxID=3350558 RepID=UPI003FA059CF